MSIPHDLYVLGSQENSVCDREWVESLRAVLKEQTELDYKPVGKHLARGPIRGPSTDRALDWPSSLSLSLRLQCRRCGT